MMGLTEERRKEIEERLVRAQSPYAPERFTAGPDIYNLLMNDIPDLLAALAEAERKLHEIPTEDWIATETPDNLREGLKIARWNWLEQNNRLRILEEENRRLQTELRIARGQMTATEIMMLQAKADKLGRYLTPEQLAQVREALEELVAWHEGRRLETEAEYVSTRDKGHAALSLLGGGEG